MVVEGRSNLQQTSFLIKTAVFSRHRNVKLRQTFIHLVYFHAFKFCLNFRFVGEAILLNKEHFGWIWIVVLIYIRIDIDNISTAIYTVF